MAEQIDSLGLFAGLPAKVRAKLMEQAHMQTFAAGEPIFMQGDPVKAFYIILSGRAKIVRVTPEGYENILCVRGPGEHFCPVPLLDNGSQLGTAIAMSDVSLLWIEHDAFGELCAESPELLLAVQGDCLTEVRHLLHRLEVVAFRSVRERVAHALLTMSRQQANPPTDTLHLTQQELGALIGATRESVSRALAEFERKQIVRLERGRVTILDHAALEKLVTERENG